jgi:hypothetical protein
MGLSWQQGPLSPGAIGRFLVRESWRWKKRRRPSEPLAVIDLGPREPSLTTR